MAVQVKQLTLVCYQIAKELLDHDADLKRRFTKVSILLILIDSNIQGNRQSLLAVIILEDLQLLIQHPKVKQVLDDMWGPPLSFRFS